MELKIKIKDKVEFDFFYENKIGIVTCVDNDIIEILGNNNIIYKVKYEKILNKIL